MSQNYWNPFRDWNNEERDVIQALLSLKTTETLLGIETKKLESIAANWGCLKTTETLLGIETAVGFIYHLGLDGLKTTETLLGIETQAIEASYQDTASQNYWNPFRDWNKIRPLDITKKLQVSKLLKPF